MKTTYKKPLTVKEQISYLEENKRVVYHDVSKEEAENILLQNNYINVITPYKHRFAKKDASGNVIRDEQNRHIYERDVDFKEYADAYFEERKKYPIIYTNIMKFETAMNAIVSQETIKGYDIITNEKFEKFIQRMENNIEGMDISDGVKQHYKKNIEEIHNAMAKYEDIYILFDRLSLNQIITIYRCVNRNIRNRIFKEMYVASVTFGYSSPGTFETFLKRIGSIRNCICHFNSLEVLINYYDIKTKDLRRDSDRKMYSTIINKLSGNLS